MKISSARRITHAKHNRLQGEGSHVDELDELLSSPVEEVALNYMAAHYGLPIKRQRALLPQELGWPVKHLPGFVAEVGTRPTPSRYSASVCRRPFAPMRRSSGTKPVS